ncbi:cytochrome-c peroxidase [Halopseudomonas pelagia]|uniref:cytochrome-c peroxidase n=1 Tax=Halopseudomonas pelagia TaxID=553151 RepID=UPI0003A002AF|nr:cytochrome c peroxidase [Halopseudomonas pelagia]|tara:strand:+ start:2837 stop:3946 length:1110 start_codon:yes stop_codon:yes gene_type:complete
MCRSRLLRCGVAVMLLNLPLTASAEPCAELRDQQFAQCLRTLYEQDIKQWPQPIIMGGGPWQELAPLPTRAEWLAQGQYDPQRARLGEQLFMDPQLSRSGQIACASCHEPSESFADGRRFSFGHDRLIGRRNSPAITTSALLGPFFWDGRSKTLEEQSMHPIEDPIEMAFSVSEALARLNADGQYPAAFAAVYGPGPITQAQLALALADFQRSLLPQRSGLDSFMRGNKQALNDQQIHGLHLFRTKGHCMTCHHGAALSDRQFHNLGMTYYGRNKYEDWGRHEVTGNPVDIGKFRTPSLRQVARTGPWMHNGLFPLRGVLNMYNAGMPRPKPGPDQDNDPNFPQTSELLVPLELNRLEIAALLAFLDAL